MQTPSAIYFQEMKKLFANSGEVVIPSKKDFESILAKHCELPDTCFHILDLRTLDMPFKHGIERIFGVPDKAYNYSTLAEFIHPSYVALFMAKALAVYRYLDHYKDTVHPTMPYYYNIFLPMKLKGGKYHRVRQMSIPFALDENGKMVLQLNIYRTGFEPYSGQPMTSFFSSSANKPLDRRTDEMKRDHIQSLQEVFSQYPQFSPTWKEHWGFTPRELELLQVIANQPDLGFAGAAKEMFIGVHRARGIWLKNGIKEKVNAIFYPRVFNTIQEVAAFFKDMDVLT